MSTFRLPSRLTRRQVAVWEVNQALLSEAALLH
jgi:hypothetical protein